MARGGSRTAGDADGVADLPGRVRELGERRGGDGGDLLVGAGLEQADEERDALGLEDRLLVEAAVREAVVWRGGAGRGGCVVEGRDQLGG